LISEVCSVPAVVWKVKRLTGKNIMIIHPLALRDRLALSINLSS